MLFEIYERKYNVGKVALEHLNDISFYYFLKKKKSYQIIYLTQFFFQIFITERTTLPYLIVQNGNYKFS